MPRARAQSDEPVPDVWPIALTLVTLWLLLNRLLADWLVSVEVDLGRPVVGPFA
jgi:hypothetical protein